MTTITLEKPIVLNKNKFIDFFDLYKYIVKNNVVDRAKLYDFELDFKELPKSEVSSEMKKMVAAAQKKPKSLFTQIVHERN
ncbi:MAG: hypothetical protein CO170_00730 [candidate division SR1 bacterium CG_4_9_14_3_um_filter_40_9]|nr:MAG: hypothetical protein CO170_00730 [candidate division SR1 bacterium CG_4_9_14_3_um_filter_40_9]